MTLLQRHHPPNEELDEIIDLSNPLGDPSDLDRIVDRIGSAHFVLLGEASHGTSEYYRWRALLTRRLIEERGFSFVAVEEDWPDCFKVNRWVKGRLNQASGPADMLAEFRRWPTWMWANEEVAAFITWLRDHNRPHRG